MSLEAFIEAAVARELDHASSADAVPVAAAPEASADMWRIVIPRSGL